MKKITITIVLSVLAVTASGQSLFDFFGFPQPQAKEQRQDEKKVKFAYDAYFQLDFDNREFAPTEGQFTNSGTIFNALLTPSVGLDVNADKKLSHRIMLGIDIVKRMGESPVTAAQQRLENWDLLRELTLYYRIRGNAGKTILTGYAGIFPRRFVQGDYGEAFFSDSLRIVDRNIEGALLTIRRPKSVYEFGCDWMGMIGSMRRERFMLFTYGESRLTPWFSMGWALTGYHYACANEYGQVADNILAEPFVKFSLGEIASMQELTAKLSFLGGLQRLRQDGDAFTVPYGGQLRLSLRNWDVGIDNTTYAGTGLMPFYNRTDDGGFKYGSNFYWGNPLYRINSSNTWNSFGWYDRLEVFYQPRLCDFASLRISAVFHFGGESGTAFRYAGSQQKLSLLFDLDKLLHPSPVKKTKTKTTTYDFQSL